MIIQSIVLAALVGGVVPYTPLTDVSSHSQIALTVANFTAVLSENNALAMDIYMNGDGQSGTRSVQKMATKDWVAAGADDTYLQGFVELFGEDYMHSYNLDAINCNGLFEGQSKSMCDISAKKNQLCTTLAYANYEGAKALAQMQAGVSAGVGTKPDGTDNKYMDELFAFWYGVYDGGEDDGKYSSAAVQGKRDSDFSTAFKVAAIAAMKNAQTAAAASPPDQMAFTAAYEAYLQTIVSTFAQATLKYVYKVETGDADSVDKYWGEAYSYFRCAGGLMDPVLGATIEKTLNPSIAESIPEGSYCSMKKMMAATADLGFGATAESLGTYKDVPDGYCDVSPYIPLTDVSSHARIALTVANFTAVLSENNALAMDIYMNGDGQSGTRSVQKMATKDWVAAGADDTYLQGFVKLFGEDYMHSYNLDAINCNGLFEGQSKSMCDISAKKNQLCTTLAYANYEGAKALAQMQAGVSAGVGTKPDGTDNKYMDELFAFWYGVYDGGEDDGKYSSAAVQGKRDSDFSTAFKVAAIAAMKDAQTAAAASPPDIAAFTAAYEAYLQTIVSTFAQATLKYVYKVETGDADSVDKYWGEAYSYFRCAGGLMDPVLGATIEKTLNPSIAESIPEG
eukprot:CAMPEP_0194159094 /NCGR_PEP_ID=MMETSP0152-20130528/77634_1 /TAXON_ID=1049557 /ORGANISM="Thalassiothrix antarctica, Strain L6-D1" /LENGTH=622 /DNA_ID=CAMNT_0038868613 /DNA_START=2127 /DNA_END=3992 /DNA_ORIENTATION=-